MALNLNPRPLAQHLGCEIRGFDIRKTETEADLAEVCDILFKHHVIAFRGQTLDADSLLDFTRKLGPIDGSHVQSEHTLPGYPDIYVISNVEKEGKALGTKTVGHHWHTDWAYKEFPAAYTLLYGCEVPAEPHHTLFASQKRVYDAMTDAERADLRMRKASYSFAKTHNAKSFYAPLRPDQLAKTPTVSHSMLRIHPGTGREGLFVNRADCVGVTGMTEADASTFINDLVERIVEPEFVYAHRWELGDLVIWDNRSVLHAATPFDMEKHRRLIYRTTVKGERPIPPEAA